MVLTRSDVKPLLELDDGRQLCASGQGCLYHLLDPASGARERISLQRAALLWEQGKREGWRRLDRPDDCPPAALPEPEASASDWREELRRQLGFPDEPEGG